jgi:hypothetical protein
LVLVEGLLDQGSQADQIPGYLALLLAALQPSVLAEVAETESAQALVGVDHPH